MERELIAKIAEEKLSEEKLRLIKLSFGDIVPVAFTAGSRFYEKLFKLDPSLRKMFSGDLDEQGQKLMNTIKSLVLSINDISSVVSIMEPLTKRHVSYGVKPEQYALVGEALISTLEEALGDSFTPEIKDAWLSLYSFLSTVMIENSNN